ncbi:MAG: glycosyltransferase 61 family protein [Gammaproteobacteria bacterium]|nr:glycosyltransferase 61 family protein [Gammaproteobacteria bacterium]
MKRVASLKRIILKQPYGPLLQKYHQILYAFILNSFWHLINLKNRLLLPFRFKTNEKYWFLIVKTLKAIIRRIANPKSLIPYKFQLRIIKKFKNHAILVKILTLNQYSKLTFKTVYEIAANKSPQLSLLSTFHQPSVKAGAAVFYDAAGNKQISIEAEVALPSCYVAKINNAKILPHTSFVIMNQQLLYDYKNQIQHCDALSKHEDMLVGAELLKHVYFKKYPTAKNTIKYGISLLEDFQFNYYHWLLETLPKLVLLDDIPGISSYPLLVPDKLPEQFYEALNIINADKREIIKLQANELYGVKDLIYLSNLSLSNEARHRLAKPDDYCISPIAINFIREKCHELFSLQTPSKLIYLERSAHYRALNNETEIKAAAISMGFEAVDCRHLNFKEQINLFSQAKFIIGPTGASFTNLIFTQNPAKALILYPGTIYENFEIFNSIAKPIGLKLSFIKGSPNHPDNVHSNYTINPKLFETLLMEEIVNNS